MISFTPLWKTMIDKGYKKTELLQAGISSATHSVLRRKRLFMWMDFDSEEGLII